MATVESKSAKPQHYVDFDEYVDFQLAKTRANIKWTEVWTTSGLIATVSLAYVLLFVVLDQWAIPGGFSGFFRIAALSALLAGAGGWLVWKVLLPSLKRVHVLFAARTIETADPALRSSLLNLVDLHAAGKQVSPGVLRAMEKRAAVELSRVNVDHAVDRRPLLRIAYALLGVVVVCCLYVLLSPKDAFSSVRRLLLPTAGTAVATRTQIEHVSPGDDQVLARTLLTVEADVLGRMPEQVTLLYTTADRKFVDQPIEMRRVEEGLPRFRGLITGDNGRGLLQALTYRITAGDVRTRDYRIGVVQPPSARVTGVDLQFPAYMRLEPRSQPNGQIDTWEGTTVRVHATTNLPVQTATLVLTDTEDPAERGEDIRMQVSDGTKLTAEWKLAFRIDGTSPRFYHIQCTTPTGDSDPEPTHYSLKIQPDQRPLVEMVHPVQDLERPANAIVPLLIRAADPDFQLRYLTLRVEKDGEAIDIPVVQILGEEQPTFEGSFDFPLEQVGSGLKAGDEIQFWVEARDNKTPLGNRTNTPRLKITITPAASEEEVQEQLDEDKQEQQQKLDEEEQQRNEESTPPSEQRQSDADQPEPMPGEEPEPGEDQPQPPQGAEEQTEGQDGKAGEGASQGKAGKSGKQPGRSADAQPGSEESSDDPGAKPSDKPGRKANDQQALQKLLEQQQKQQQQKPDPSQKPDAGEKQPGDKSEDKDDSPQPGSDPDGGEQRGSQDPSAKKPPTDPPAGEQPQSGDSKSPENRPPGKRTDPKSSPGKDPQTKPSPMGAEEQPPSDKANSDPMPDSDGGNPDGDSPDGDNPDEPKPAGGDPKNQPGDSETPQKEPKPGEKGGPKGGMNSDDGDSENADEGDDPAEGGKPTPKTSDTKTPPKPGAGGDEAADQPMPPNNQAKKSRGAEGGEERPAEDSPDAEQRQATGDETGEGTPQKNPTGNEPKAKQPNELKRKDGTKPTPDPKSAKPADDQKPGADPQPGTGSETPEGTPTQPDENTPPNPNRQDKTGDEKTTNPRQKNAGKEPTAQEELKGKGRPDQKSQEPDGGEGGGGTPQDEGDEGSKRDRGPGENRPEPGAEGKPSEKGDQPSDQKGKGKSTRPKPGAKPGEGESDGENQQPADKPGQPSPSAKPGKPGDPHAAQSPEGGGADAGEGDQPRPDVPQRGQRGGNQEGDAQPGSGGDSGGEQADAPNLEHTKEASNLVLKRLQDELKRGEVDEKLLEELGWTEQDMERFAKRLENQLQDPGDDQSPEAEARRRQFETMLESLNLSDETAVRKGVTRDKSNREGTNIQRLPVPAEYRELYDAYTRGLSKQPARKPKP